MKRLYRQSLMLFLFCIGMSFGAKAAAGTSEYTDVVILSTTDMHGKCWETNLLSDAPEPHNMLRVSTAVREFREAYGEDHVLLIDNGDLIQGTPLSEHSVTGLDENLSAGPPVMPLCLSEIGYTAFIPGNHEFNYSWTVMRAVYDWLEENGVPVISANFCYDGTAEGTKAGENVFAPYIIRTVTVNGHAHRIGILGLENTDTTRWDLPDHYPGMQFAHPGNDNCSMAEETDLFIPEMKEAGCEFIIVSYHGALGTADKDLVFGVNSEDQGLRIVKNSRDIDLLITGHDHSTSYSDQAYPNAEGRKITVVNGGGQELTHTVFRFREDENGSLTWEMLESSNISLDEYEPDEALQQIVKPYADEGESYVMQPAGTAVGEWDENRRFYIEQTDTIDLVSKICMDMTTRRLAEKAEKEGAGTIMQKAGSDHLDVDMSMTSVVSDNYVVTAGPVSFRNIYSLYRFSNTIAVLPMTGEQIRAVIEENAANRLTARVHDGEVFKYPAGDMYTNIVFGGLDFVYDMAMPAGERVQIEGFANGRAFEAEKVYLVAVNNYILGNENCGLRIFSTDDAIWSQGKDDSGRSIQDLIGEYLLLMQKEKGGVSPEDFNWHWEIVYSAGADDDPGREIKAAARLETLPEDGGRYILYQEAEGRAFGGWDTTNGFESVKWEVCGTALPAPVPEAALVFTAHAETGDLFRFTDPDGRYLVCGPTGGLMTDASPEEEELSRWRLEPAYGGWNIINAGAEGDQAIQCYTGRFVTYRNVKNSNFIFNFYRVGDE